MPAVQHGRIERRADLGYQEGRSDKVYHITLEEVEGGYVVNFLYGPRNKTLNAGTKTPAPVSLARASATYESVYNEKYGKGYRPLAGAFGGYVAPAAEAPPALLGDAQLLTDASSDELAGFILDPAYCLEEKVDGENMQLKLRNGRLTAVNKKGKARGYPERLKELETIFPDGDTDFDTESVGETTHVFGLLALRGEDLRTQPYVERRAALELLFAEIGAAAQTRMGLLLVAHETTAPGKRQLIDAIAAKNGEGVVAKRLDARHTPGRPASGGTQRRFKFRDECTARVAAHSAGKASIALEMLDEEGQWVGVGKVTVPPSCPMPAVGSFVEVRYRHYNPGGALFEPVLKGARTDVDATDCALNQLRIKAAEQPA